ncbi:MAG: elongation factor G [Planctomycetota bacterium]|nr:elongation factor G [Planctomycetota bacterium]
MAKHQLEDIRNIVFVGHGESGKTSLIDAMLFKAGATSRHGSVDDHTSVLDTDEDERERKHSITSSVAHFTFADKFFQVIDTPGYPDFIGQALGALNAVETAVVVVNAHSGLEVNTRRMFAKAGEAGLGRMVVLNKLDSDNLDFDVLLSNLQETFGMACIPVNVPVGLGKSFSGVVDTLHLPASIPEGVATDPKAINQKLLDSIVEADESLMERYLEGDKLSDTELAHGMTKAIRAGTLIPVYCTAAKTDVGIKELMEDLATEALSPVDLPRTTTNAVGETVTLNPGQDEPLVAYVFKTRIDPFVSKMNFLRIYAGSLHKDQSVYSVKAGKILKIGQLMEMQGTEHANVSEASSGDIVTVVKLDELHVGDTLCKDEAHAINLNAIGFPTPMIGLAVEPKSRADQQKISGALQKIEEEDQTFHVTRDAQTKEMVMHGMSELHLQIVEGRLAHRDKVEIITHQPKIPYRETCSGDADGHYRHKKQSGGSGQFAEVHLRVASLPQGINPEEYFTKDRFLSLRSYHYDPVLNYAFIDRVSGGSVPNQFIPAVEKGIKERMERGVLAGYQVQDVSVELFFGKDHPVDSNESAFKMAGSLGFRDIFTQAKPALLEPIVTIEITVPSDKLGDITSDLNGRRGRVEGMDNAGGGYQTIRAKVPLSEVMTYSRSLSSMTGGQGSFIFEFSHYEPMPPNEQAKVVASAKHAKEEDE